MLRPFHFNTCLQNDSLRPFLVTLTHALPRDTTGACNGPCSCQILGFVDLSYDLLSSGAQQAGLGRKRVRLEQVSGLLCLYTLPAVVKQ